MSFAATAAGAGDGTIAEAGAKILEAGAATIRTNVKILVTDATTLGTDTKVIEADAIIVESASGTNARGIAATDKVSAADAEVTATAKVSAAAASEPMAGAQQGGRINSDKQIVKARHIEECIGKTDGATEQIARFSVKAAVVDVESILEHSFAIQHIKKSITTINNKIQEELSVKDIELKHIESDLIKQRGTLDRKKFELKVAEFNKKVSMVQREKQKKKSALERAHAEAIALVQKNMNLVISELSKKHGFNMVFPSMQLLFVSHDLNITLEVITKLNKRLKKVDIKYELYRDNKSPEDTDS